MARCILESLIKKYPVLQASKDEIWDAYEVLLECYKNGGKVLICGNGGSAADCDHIVGELMKGFMKKRPIDASLAKAIDADGEAFSDKLQGGLPAINLTAHAALVAAVGNDLGGDVVYAQQVMGYGRAGDVLLGISTSGNADNVSKAVRVAKAMGMKTIGLTGIGGGKLYSLCDVTIRVSADSTPDIQELHLPVYHALCSMIESEFFTV